MLEALPITIHGYQFLEEIGKGGFSNVYLVYSSTYNQQFVAKVQKTEYERNSKQIRAFTAEVDALASLNHPNIIKLYDHFFENQYYIMILEYCPFGTLNDLMKEEKNKSGMNSENFKWFSRQIIEALNEVHKSNMSHHDIKPHNILIDGYGRPKLADFGLCLQNCKNDVLTSSFSGSLSFMAPEILQHQPFDPQKADMWSLGVMFMYMLTGELPFKIITSQEQLKRNIMNCSYDIHKILPRKINSIIRRLMMPDPNRRFTCEELLNLPFYEKITQNDQSRSFNSSISSLKMSTSCVATGLFRSCSNFNALKPNENFDQVSKIKTLSNYSLNKLTRQKTMAPRFHRKLNTFQ
ncbi:CAMK family protein kinase [Tritrichomonas foetus]|uniref:CAMK family protein kinase n=1 Tax=Tritrichomonas foetus TaxID=1144522 RepID=A0A1J4KUR3_9EUKA|nr:CAMK family protein kinase [Tritrichomonas foetus]|eukprot:OHT15011.1 CAMK family protein kinase [Tritrichomonas foetus]